MLPSRKRVRIRLSWLPTWEGPIQSWARSFIQKNLWRCDSIHDAADLEQDCYLIFLKICSRYPRVVEIKHFMALFKTAVRNQMHDRARYVRLKRAVEDTTSDDVSIIYADRIGERTNAGYLYAALSQAPPELRLALRVIDNNPPELHAKQERRETLNMKLRRVTGVNLDFMSGLTSLLQET